MPDERVAKFCAGCGAPNPGKKQVCPECGASLVVPDDPPATALPHNNTVNGGKNQRTTLIMACAAVLVLIIAALFLGGILSPLFPQMVVGTYRQSGDTFGLALSELNVNADGTFSGDLLSHGSWEIEGNRLKVTYLETRLIQKPCTGAIIPWLCPVETYQVPSGTVKYWTIGWNTLEQDGEVWHKGEPGALGMWRNY